MKDKLGELQIERDPKTGQIKRFTVPAQMSEKALLGALFVLLDSLYTSLDKFSLSNNRYSLTLAVLTGVLVIFTIIQIVLFVSR